MPRIKKFNSKHIFKGNRYVLNKSNKPIAADNQTSSTSDINLDNPNKISASAKKLSQSKLPCEFDVSISDVNVIFNLELLSSIINSFTKCKYCNNENCVSVRLDNDYQNGLAHKIIIECNICNEQSTGMNSNVIRNVRDINIRFAYAMRSIGKGMAAGKLFCAMMNLAPPNAKVQKYNQLLLRAATEVCDASTRNAAIEAIEENDGCKDITGAFDGTWQKRGFTSLNGVITVTSFDTGKVLDFESFSKYCAGCKNKHNQQSTEKKELHKKMCSCNYSGSSGGMEVEGARRICARSETKLGVRYTQYLGDGDSKGFSAVLEAKPYGNEVEIKKMECVGHVQKRLGSRLRRFKKENKLLKFSDGKGLGGKGRLTDDVIDKLQLYYGLAIRKNLSSIADMRKAIWASYLHKLSSDDNPNHSLCPIGADTWCGYNKASENGTKFTHKHSLPNEIMQAIKPIYIDLSHPELLKRCLHGKTQNPNESFNKCIWQRVPKTEFVGHTTLKLGVTDAVICFNEGSIAKANVLERLQIKPGKFTIDILKSIDKLRIKNAEIAVTEERKRKRIVRRQLKRRKEDTDDGTYCPGGF